MSSRPVRLLLCVALVSALFGSLSPASATPVCTDGYKGGPPLSLCGGRVFPEADNAVDYIQFTPDPVTGFREYVHGMEYLAEQYPRWVSVFTLRKHYKDKDAVSAGPDGIRSYEKGDSGDGHDIFVVKLTDHRVPDKGKETLLYSLSVHGDEKGGIEGGARAVEDLILAAENGGKIADGVKGYESTTGVKPKFNEYEVSKVLKNEVVYLVNFNSDGWVAGDHFDANALPNAGGIYTRQNEMGTDLNRQMPTVGWTNPQRNPLEESEMNYGHRFMHDVADAGIGGRMAYGADIHGEGQSRAWVDIMYPAGQFDSVKHRRLMSIAERTKSMIDASLFFGIPDMIEEQTGGDGGEGIEDYGFPVRNVVPTKPARWGTVWDTLGYTDTGFIGDYMATELGVTGMDYEIAFNHSDVRAYGRPWGVLLQENYINASRQIIKTALAYAMTERKDFANFKIDPKGRVGYVFDPDRVEHDDEDGSGVLPGPNKDGVGANGKKVPQRPYSASQMDFFADEDRYVIGGFNKVTASEVAAGGALRNLDSLVLADVTAPDLGRAFSEKDYYASLRDWVKDGGNLVLTDGALEVLEEIGAVDQGTVNPITVYQPHTNIADFEHPMVAGLRKNARQLAEFTLIGFPIGSSASPMHAVQQQAWEDAGGHVVGTTNDTQPAGEGGQGTAVTVGEMKFGKGRIRILGGGLHRPTEDFDHRYGLKDYALTYSGLFILENSIKHDAPGLGGGKSGSRAADSFADVMATLG